MIHSWQVSCILWFGKNIDFQKPPQTQYWLRRKGHARGCQMFAVPVGILRTRKSQFLKALWSKWALYVRYLVWKMEAFLKKVKIMLWFIIPLTEMELYNVTRESVFQERNKCTSHWPAVTVQPWHKQRHIVVIWNHLLCLSLRVVSVVWWEHLDPKTQNIHEVLTTCSAFYTKIQQ